jgi:hypothetical protein
VEEGEGWGWVSRPSARLFLKKMYKVNESQLPVSLDQMSTNLLRLVPNILI